ncbi:MAG TPA: S8 family serine peptidase, partial [Cytophagales bacterium]|nr:S8 family serine peptidase [Cytophagales bacterium]
MKIQLLLLIFFTPIIAFSQKQQEDTYKINYKSGSFIPSGTTIQKRQNKSSALRTEAYPGSYKLIQFYQIPSLEEQNKLQQSGIELLEYIPNNAYWAFFSADPNSLNIEEFKIRALEDISPKSKIDPQLLQEPLPKWAIKSGKLALIIKYFKNQSPLLLKQKLKELECEITRELAEHHQLEILVSKEKVQEIAFISNVSYIYPVAPPSKVNILTGVKHHNLNVLNSNGINGRNLNGEGIVIGVGDGGYLSFHHDYQKRINNPDKEYSSIGDHAAHVAGIIAGCGNINPDVKGGANKASLINYSFQNVILNAPFHFQKDEMVITSNSYGFEYYYGIYDYNSSLVDKQVKEYPNLLHVFSAGNDYDLNTVSGSFNSAKNVLTVGSVDRSDFIADYSSKGPVADGRLKPEIVAMGSHVTSVNSDFGYNVMSGTSMATPAISSVAALLYQRYKQLNNKYPEAALIKAIMCNSAEDLGNFGPDYFYGFGKVNARRAVEAIEAKRYIVDSVKQNYSKSFSINVPASSRKIKVMVYWNDKEASNVSALSLVNDLDLELSSGTEKFLPMTLDPLDPYSNAIPGKDHINNVEQVSLDNPKAGTYNINVRGYKLPFAGNQKFVVTYEIIKPEIVLSHPFGGESFAPGEEIEIKWDNYTGHNLAIEYSLNNGTSWEIISYDFPSNESSFFWEVPEVSSKGIIRVRAGSYTSQSMPFDILGTPKNLTTTLVSSQSVNLTWDAVTEATGYDVFLLDPEESEMKLVGNTSALSYSFKNLDKSASYLFSVRAKTNQLTGKRSIGARIQLNTPTFEMVNPTSNSAFNACEPVKIKAVVAEGSVSKMDVLLDGVPIYQDWEAPYETQVSYPAGTYNVEVQITNEYGAKTIRSATFTIVTPAPLELPFVADFEDNNGQWISFQKQGENIWHWGTPEGELINTAGDGSKAWFTKITSDVLVGEEFSVITPSFNLKEEQGPIVLSFKQNLALASIAEGVFVEYSSDCGQSWSSLGNRTSNGLNWYNSKLVYWNGDYFSNKDAWTNEKTGWREVKIVVPQSDLSENNVQFKLTYYLQPDAQVRSEGVAIDDFKMERFVDKKINRSDSLALVAFYHSLNGSNWHVNTNWLSAPVKDWFGIETFEGRVTNISLWNNNLYGSIPDEIGDLTELKNLALSFNQINGNLPAGIGNLQKLAVIDLTQNELRGEVPSQIGNCSDLYWLFLNNNKLEGALPEEIGNLGKLEWAFFDANKLSGALPASVKNCDNLEWLNLNFNKISSLPDLNGAKRKFELNVQNNNLTFEHIEPNLAFFPFSYYYENQDSLGVTESHELDPGTDFTISADFAGKSANNRYQWIKDGKAITGQFYSPTFNLKNVPAGFKSVYYCAITNTAVEGLTIYTRPVYITVKNPRPSYRLNVGGEFFKAWPISWEADSENSPSTFLSSASSEAEAGCEWQ